MADFSSTSAREANRDEAPRIACEWDCDGSGIATADNEAQCETCGRWSEGDHEADGPGIVGQDDGPGPDPRSGRVICPLGDQCVGHFCREAHNETERQALGEAEALPV